MIGVEKSIFFKITLHQLRFLLAFIFLIGISNFSCTKKTDTNNDINNNTNNDQYYVKYEVNSSTIYFGGTLNVILKGEDNINKNFTINTRSPWETTIGPVKKGFTANLSVNEITNNYGQLKLQAKISVNKNGSPFAVKQNDDSNTPRTSVQINYTIDY